MIGYSNQTIATSEIGTALENFIYGFKVKMSIPSLVPFLNQNDTVTEKRTINKGNILNKDIEALRLSSCEACNYIEVYVPEELYRYRNLCSKRLTYKGNKGEQFLISFIGGDINKPVAVRRL